MTYALRRAGAGTRKALFLAACGVVVPVASVWFWDREDFREVCEGEGRPQVLKRALADGVFLNSGTSNSFGMRYLHDEGFSWIEAPSIYRRNKWVRYEKQADGKITTTEIDSLTARYEVREVFSQPFGHTGLMQTQVVDRETGEVMARAGKANFDGGKAKWFLGAWGSSYCPSAMHSSEDFRAFYHLAKDTLRSGQKQGR
ncbi:hypothetical protein [Ottowia sp.]|uniref:hypothetical protein n=1 Tax=Ottowia sp. TaxID=1898956 RepID=UPI0025D96213|nr:hypothetical protein [Ottowia sp.]MBK6616649.1 hypothetical protein [Ottowia sp.]